MIVRLRRQPLLMDGWAGWPTSEIWVPHLRDGSIVAKVGYRLGQIARVPKGSEMDA